MKLLEALDRMHDEQQLVRDSVSITRETAIQEAQGAKGYRRLRESGQPKGEYLRALTEVAKLITGVRKGITPDWKLKEAMTTSDFPLLLGDLMYKQLLGNYAPYPVTYPAYSAAFDLKDFKNLNLLTIDGGSSVLEKVKEEGPYPEITFTEARYQLAVVKYGRRYGLSFELFVNDDLNSMDSRPMQMAIGARRLEEKTVTQQFVAATGPHASFYTVGNANIVTGNPALSIPALQTAMTILSKQVDSDGEPIMIDMFTLVVGPALSITAQNMLNGLQIRLHEAGGATNTELIALNWMKAKFELKVNPYLPIVCTASGIKDTQWYLFANPSNGQRPALAHGFLRGHRNPQMYMKDSDQILIGGGPSGIMEGNFGNDGIDYKIRHFFGAIRVDPKMTVASEGDGT